MIKGAVVLMQGVKLLLQHAELRALLWRMSGLLAVLLLLLTGAVFWLADYLAQLWIPDGDSWYWQLLSWLAVVLAFVLALVCAVVSFVSLGSIAVAPWLDALAVRSEALVGVHHEHGVSISSGALVLQSLANSVRPLLLLLGWGAVALLFFWLPPVATAIWSYGSIRFLGFELLDTPASRRHWGFAERQQELKRKRWFYIGFAALAALLLMVPLLNLLVLPAAVVGLSVEWSKEEALP